MIDTTPIVILKTILKFTRSFFVPALTVSCLSWLLRKLDHYLHIIYYQHLFVIRIYLFMISMTASRRWISVRYCTCISLCSLTYSHLLVTFYHVDIFTQSPRISLANGFMANRFMKILFLLLCFGRRHMSTLKLSASQLVTTAWHPSSSWLRRWSAKVFSSTIFWRDSCRLCHDPTRWEASFNYWFYVVTLTNILCRTVSLNSSWRSLWITTSRSICSGPVSLPSWTGSWSLPAK